MVGLILVVVASRDYNFFFCNKIYFLILSSFDYLFDDDINDGYGSFGLMSIQ